MEHPTVVNRLARQQSDLNASTSDRWDEFSGHRAQVTRLALAAATPAARICVLGAGNCNDLDLPSLARGYPEIVLVDLDANALTRGIARQEPVAGSRIIPRGGFDLTGCLDEMESWSPAEQISASHLEQLSNGADACPLAGPYEVVLSACVYSQLIGSLVRTVGDQHPQFVPAVQAIRRGHFRLLSRLLRPGGNLIFLTDIVSSDTAPELATVADGEFERYVGRLIGAKNYFTGTHPATILETLRADERLRRELDGVSLIPPWRWSLGARTYAVYGVSARKH